MDSKYQLSFVIIFALGAIVGSIFTNALWCNDEIANIKNGEYIIYKNEIYHKELLESEEQYDKGRKRSC